MAADEDIRTEVDGPVGTQGVRLMDNQHARHEQREHLRLVNAVDKRRRGAHIQDG